VLTVVRMFERAQPTGNSQIAVIARLAMYVFIT
jgi:hypothetical protein